MNYTKKSFSVPMGSPSSEFADRWEQTFGKKTHLEGNPTELSDLPFATQETILGGPLAAHLAARKVVLANPTASADVLCVQCERQFDSSKVTGERRTFGERNGKGEGWYCIECWSS